MTDLILGQAFRYTFEQLEPFVRSLKTSGFTGETVLFVNRIADEGVARLRASGIDVRRFHYRGSAPRNPAHEAWPWVRWLGQLPLPFPLRKALLRPLVNIPWLRMLLYYDFLQAAGPERHGRVMLTDVRDVLFQGDPFIAAKEPGLRVFLEDRSMTIGTSQANRRWIEEMFGREVLEELAPCPISCSGTIIGDRASILRYLRTFIETASKVRSIYLNGGDQGIHNFLLHRGRLAPVTMLENGTAEVLTMGYCDCAGTIGTDAAGRLVDAAQRPFAVLHQYDRHPEIAAQLLAQAAAA